MKDLVSPFAQRIYDALLKVPAGKITTYKDLAHAVGTRAYRAVGVSLSKNPFAPDVPCHRVIASDGSIGGFMRKKSGPDVERKKKMLKNEGIPIEYNQITNFQKYLYQF